MREAEEAAAALSQGKRAAAGRKRPQAARSDPEIRELEQKLIEKLGTKVEIRGGRREGRIEIAYFSADDLDRLLELLQGADIGRIRPSSRQPRFVDKAPGR